jgi:predicted secreted Zn-dependent protease
MINSSLLAAVAFAAAFQEYGAPAPRPASPAPRPVAPTTAETSAPATAAQVVIPTSPPGRALKDLPNVTVRYYDVAGKNLKEVIKSITDQRPKDASGQPVTATTSWSIKTEFSKRTDGKGGCKIVDARASLNSSPELPRLLNEKSFNKRDLNSWQAYAAGLETKAAAKLWFVNDHVGDVEKALLAAPCDTVDTISAAAIEQLRKRSTELQAPATTVATAPPPAN